MFFYSTIIYLLVYQTVFYSTSILDLSTNIETGTMQPVLSAIVPSTQASKLYTISFKNIYTTAPKVMVTSKGFRNCKDSQFLDNFVAPSPASTTSININIYCYAIPGTYDLVIPMRIHYLAFDQQTNLNMKIYSNYYSSNMLNSKATITTTGDPLDPSSTVVKCFLNSIHCHTTSSYFLKKTSCQIISSNTIEYSVNTTDSLHANCPSFLHSYNILVIRPDNSLILNYNSLIILNGFLTSISINIAQPNSIFVIGLTGFKTSTPCIQIMLKNNDIQLDTLRSSYYDDVIFDFLHITYKNDTVSLTKIISAPFEAKVHLEYLNLEKYIILSSSHIVFDSQLIYIGKVNNLVSTSISTTINSNPIQINITFTNHLKTSLASTTTTIMTVDLMTVNVVDRTLDVQFFNLIQVPSLTDFDSSIGGLTKNQITVMGTKKVLNIKFQRQVIGVPFYLNYLSSVTSSKTSQYLIIPTISLIETSATSISSSMSINSIPNSMSVLVSQFAWVSTNVNSEIFHTVNSNGIIMTTFNYLLNAKTSPLVVSYKPQAISDFKVIFNMKLVTVKSLEVVVEQGICKLIFMNAVDIEEAVSQDFATTLASLGVSQVQQDGNDAKAVLKYDASHVGQNFSASFSPASGVYKAITADLKIVERFIKIEADVYDHWINFTLKNVQGVSLMPIITLSHEFLSIENLKFISDTILISTKFSRTVDGDWLSISYEIDHTTIYYEIITLELYHTFPLVYCVAQFNQEAETYKYFSSALVILYWGTFLASCFLCQKIYAVELLLALQFSYVSLIPIGVYCPPFTSLHLLKYSFGWNGIPLPLTQKKLNYYYSALNIQSNFLSNVNFMLFVPLLLSIGLYFILTRMGNKSTNSVSKSRLLKYGKTFLLDIPFALVVLNSCNICLSLSVSFQSFGVTNTFSLISSLIATLLIVVTIILFFIYKEHFNQFRIQFCDRLQICGASIQKSTKVRQMYPVLILIEIMLLSIFSSIQTIFNAGLYVDLTIVVCVTIIVVIICPYSSKKDNIRLFIHRFLLVVMCLLQIGFKKLKDQSAESATIFPWFFLFILILMLVALNIPYIIYKGTIWVKGKDVWNKSAQKRQQQLKLRRKQNQRHYQPLNYSRFPNRAEAN